jgi:hypothetical protein
MQTLLIRPTTTLGAGATNPNVLAGQSVEYFGGKPGILTLYGNGDALLFTHSLFMNDGQDIRTVVPPGSVLSLAGTVGKIRTNEDFIGQWAIPSQVRLVHAVTNGGAAASNFIMMYVIT